MVLAVIMNDMAAKPTGIKSSHAAHTVGAAATASSARPIPTA